MSCHIIYYKGGAKMMRPVLSGEQYRSIRDSKKNVRNRRKAAEGDETAKRGLVQMNYS